MSAAPISQFQELALPPSLLSTIEKLGYVTPSPIQAQTIPLLLAGRDLVGQAQTGTGKTAAFALPALAQLQPNERKPQVLVLTPTRELAIQVAEAFERYAQGMARTRVLAVYGGQDYTRQIKALSRGVDVVVGTPGRLMDHLRRGTLHLDALRMVVLDEGDEMLRMGFIDDVEWILEKTPKSRQVALFSATMPPQIRRIADRHLKNPETVTIQVKTSTADTIRQRCWVVQGTNKLDALSRILESEPCDGMIVFVRTRSATTELATQLESRGYAAAALNGEMAQAQRERTVERLKQGKLDILVATDVAARGLDVERISHVINYDIPHDTEAYVHRIGRTGRAGRSGEAILFVAPRERRIQNLIEKATRRRIEPMELPSNNAINKRRIARFEERLQGTLDEQDLSTYLDMLDNFRKKQDLPPLKVAAALAFLLQSEKPFMPMSEKERKSQGSAHRSTPRDASTLAGSGSQKHRNQYAPDSPPAPRSRDTGSSRTLRPVPDGMERFRVEVGADAGVKPANIVGAIANEAGMDSQYIGQIQINENHSLVDLPEGMPRAILKDLRKAWICGKPMRIARESEAFKGNHTGANDKATSQTAKKSDTASKPKKPRTSTKEKKKNKLKKLRKAEAAKGKRPQSKPADRSSKGKRKLATSAAQA